MDSFPSAPIAPSETPDETIRRLTAELHEAHEHQTATTELLQIVNNSLGDLAPVFDAMLERAIRLCGGDRGVLWRIDDQRGQLAAARGLSNEFIELLVERGESGTNPPLQQVIGGERVIEFPDTAQSEFYRSGDPLARAAVGAGVRSLIWVALVSEDVPVGAFAIGRPQVGPFSDRQIALLQNFAAQAVIAMENARLITETREALEQQTATAEVLQVINSSPGDLGPVFDAMLEKAHSLCGADHGSLFLQDGEIFRAIASRGMPEAMTGPLREGIRANDSPLAQPLRAGKPFVHVHDSALDEHPNWIKRALDVVSSHRTLLSIPLRKGDALLGMIVAGRFEVRPFSDKQIALLQNFAAQAVIAMENARLITETREALEQQTATAEVLQVINSSPGSPVPVFDAMLDKATRLCEANFGIMNTYDGERFSAAAAYRVPAALIEWQDQHGPSVFGPGTAPAQIAGGENLVHTVDLIATEAYQRGDPSRRALVDLGGARSHLIVALRKDNALLGTIAVYRQEVRPFTDKQIVLLQNFAAQAVIAMENARLITETRGIGAADRHIRSLAGHQFLAR
jgi:GAF domain-containing protein